MTGTRTPKRPQLAARLLALVSGEDDRRYLLADFEEEFEERLNAAGLVAARAWYWRETLRSIGPLAVRRARTARTPSARRSLVSWRDAFGDLKYVLRLSARSPLAPLAIVVAAK